MAPKYPHADLTYEIVGAFYDVYNALGNGYREVVYERALSFELARRNLRVERQVEATVWFRNRSVGKFRPDLVVERKVLVELKTLPFLQQSHARQVVNALRATRLEVGLLLNFGPKAEVRRLVLTRPSRGQSA